MRSNRSLQRSNVAAAISALTASEALAFSLSRISGITFSSDLESELVYALYGDPKEILGIRSSGSLMRSDLILRHIHPDDRFRTLQLLESLLREGADSEQFKITYRWIRPDTKEVRVIMHTSAVEFQQRHGSEVKQLVSCLYDVTNIALDTRVMVSPLEGLTEHLHLLGDCCLLLDSEMRVRSWKLSWNSLAGPFGEPAIRKMDLRNGIPFISLIRDETKKREWQVRLDDALALGISSAPIEWQEGERHISMDVVALSKDDVPYGILVRLNDVSEKYYLSNSAKLSFEEIQKSKVISWAALRLTNDLLSLSGLNSIISRHASPHSLASSAAQESHRILKDSIELSQLISSKEFCNPQVQPNAELNQLVTQIVKNFSLEAGASVKLALSLGTAIRLKCDQSLAKLAVRRVLSATHLLNKLSPSISLLTDRSRGPVGVQLESTWGRLLIRISVPSTRLFSWPDLFLTELENIEQALQSSDISLAISNREPGEIAVTLYFPGQELKSSALSIESKSDLQIALLDSDATSQSAYRNMIVDLGFACSVFTNLSELGAFLHREVSPIVILRSSVIDTNFTFIIRRIKRLNSTAKIIVLNSTISADAELAERAGAISSLQEPVDPVKFKNVLLTAIKLKSLSVC